MSSTIGCIQAAPPLPQHQPSLSISALSSEPPISAVAPNFIFSAWNSPGWPMEEREGHSVQACKGFCQKKKEKKKPPTTKQNKYLFCFLATVGTVGERRVPCLVIGPQEKHPPIREDCASVPAWFWWRWFGWFPTLLLCVKLAVEGIRQAWTRCFKSGPPLVRRHSSVGTTKREKKETFYHLIVGEPVRHLHIHGGVGRADRCQVFLRSPWPQFPYLRFKVNRAVAAQLLFCWTLVWR